MKQRIKNHLLKMGYTLSNEELESLSKLSTRLRKKAGISTDEFLRNIEQLF